MTASPDPVNTQISTRHQRSAIAVVALAVTGTGIGLAGTDLVLPAVPELPSQLGGTAGTAQLVLSAYAIGTAIGLLLWGSIASRLGHARVLVGGIGLLAVTSAAAAASTDLGALVVIRAVQGVAGAAPAVVAPGIIRESLGVERAPQGLALLGSIESLVPAAAPVFGAAIMVVLGWRGPFLVLTAASVAAAGVLLVLQVRRPLSASSATPGLDAGSYRRVLLRARFLRLGLAQALMLAGLLTFVFAAPSVIVNSLDGTVSDFVLMQVVNVAAFIVVANLSPGLARRFGASAVVTAGSVLALAGAFTATTFGWLDPPAAAVVILIFMPINVGLGLRGPTGFHLALEASDDSPRGAALILFCVMTVAAAGNAVVAAMLRGGLLAVGATTSAILTVACLLTLWSRQADDFG